jgi:transposase
MNKNQRIFDLEPVKIEKESLVGNEANKPLDADHFRNEKIISYTLLGMSMSRIASELGIHRSTVKMVLKSEGVQQRLNEEFQSIEHAMISLPEITGIALEKLKALLERNDGGAYRRNDAAYRSLDSQKFDLEVIKVTLNLATKIKEIEANVTLKSVATHFLES